MINSKHDPNEKTKFVKESEEISFINTNCGIQKKEKSSNMLTKTWLNKK